MNHAARRALSTAARREYTYDLCVIGGGSGGLAAAKEAARLGKRVALFDYVKPSTRGTTWGLGGTCVNVGCIPKKLMHHAGGIGATLRDDARKFGWALGDQPFAHRWETLRDLVQNHVRSLNFFYRIGLPAMDASDDGAGSGGGGVEYFNALAAFDSADSVVFHQPAAPLGGDPGGAARLRAAHFIVAVGGRPVVPPDVEGAAELAVTSDDIWTLDGAPGRTLCVGGGYVALETAGFLTSFGAHTAVALRSIALRGFDRQCAEKIVELMGEMGTEFVVGDAPASIARRADGAGLDVVFARSGATRTFDTVVYAVGRAADVGALGLDAAGVSVSAASGKIVVDAEERTSAANVWAVVSFLLCTVTFYANLAHSLTRSP
jgi:thioredoxin reductase (NADPH)